MEIIPKKFTDPIKKIVGKFKPKEVVVSESSEERRKKESDYYKRIRQVNPRARIFDDRRKTIRERNSRSER
jgi:hypothetical protein